MTESPVFKYCEHCQNVMTRKPRQKVANWITQRFCSVKCRSRAGNGVNLGKKEKARDAVLNKFLYGRLS